MVAPWLLATWLSSLVFPGLRSDTDGFGVHLDRWADVSVCLLAIWLSSLVFPGLRSDTNGLDVHRRADISVGSLANCEKKRALRF